MFVNITVLKYFLLVYSVIWHGKAFLKICHSNKQTNEKNKKDKFSTNIDHYNQHQFLHREMYYNTIIILCSSLEVGWLVINLIFFNLSYQLFGCR